MKSAAEIVEDLVAGAHARAGFYTDHAGPYRRLAERAALANLFRDGSLLNAVAAEIREEGLARAGAEVLAALAMMHSIKRGLIAHPSLSAEAASGVDGAFHTWCTEFLAEEPAAAADKEPALKLIRGLRPLSAQATRTV